MKIQWLSCVVIGWLALLGLHGCGAGKDVTGRQQEDLGRGIVAGTLGDQRRSDGGGVVQGASVVTGQVITLEGGAYVIRELDGRERRIPHDQNTRIDRPAHVGDQIQAVMDDRDRAVSIRNSDPLGSEG